MEVIPIPVLFLLEWPVCLGFCRYDRLLETCSIALVGKYTKFSDSYASVIKALEHSALAINHKLDIKVGMGLCVGEKTLPVLLPSPNSDWVFTNPQTEREEVIQPVNIQIVLASK